MSEHASVASARADEMMRLAGVTPDDRFLLRVEAPLSPMWVSALAKATDVLAERHPSLTAPERLARIIAAGCCAILDESVLHRNAPQGASHLQPKGVSTMKSIHLPPLAEGEIYVGAIGDASGNLHHVILLPGDNDDAPWEAQTEWAKSIGGDLPNRIEQAMLLANRRDQFQDDWYWSNETHHAESGWAWSQDFDGGVQCGSLKSNELRARAVRRLPI